MSSHFDHIQPDQQFLDKLPLRQLHSQSPHHHNFTDHENDLFAASHNLIEQENAVQLRSYGATIFDIFRTHGSSVESGISGFTNSTYFTQRDLLRPFGKEPMTCDFEWRFVNPVDLDLQLSGFSKQYSDDPSESSYRQGGQLLSNQYLEGEILDPLLDWNAFESIQSLLADRFYQVPEINRISNNATFTMSTDGYQQNNKLFPVEFSARERCFAPANSQYLGPHSGSSNQDRTISHIPSQKMQHLLPQPSGNAPIPPTSKRTVNIRYLPFATICLNS